jgi:hypothetical protein
MAELNDIQDYSFLDEVLNKSLESFKRKLFGNYDDKTGYFEESIPDEDESDVVNDAQTDAVNEGVNEDGMTEEEQYNDVFEEEGGWPGMSMMIPSKGGEPNNKSLSQQIADKESSGGNYKALNKRTNAVGKYQFLWKYWGDDIKKKTGVKNEQEFLNNPAAQESFYSAYEKTHLLPGVKKLKKEITTDLTDSQVAKLIHFRGENGARKYLKGELPDKPESYNMSISKYIKKAGGMPVAKTKQQQNIGLNDPELDQLYMPLKGNNPIRGLDSGEPVFITDEQGNDYILHGPQDVVNVEGPVFEKRIKR